MRRPEVLTRWLEAYAGATATTASFEKTRDAATDGVGDKPAKSTTQPYRDVLSGLWLLDPVPPWIPSGNRLNRLAQSPQHHLADPALAVRSLGHLFESLVTLSVKVFAQLSEATVGHLRLHSGRREVDLIVERADRRVLALEVKLGNVVNDGDVENLMWLRERLGDALLGP